jgi:hypothetical protein
MCVIVCVIGDADGTFILRLTCVILEKRLLSFCEYDARSMVCIAVHRPGVAGGGWDDNENDSDSETVDELSENCDTASAR